MRRRLIGAKCGSASRRGYAVLSNFTGFQFGQMSEYQGSTPGEKCAMARIFFASCLVGAGEEQSAVKLSSSIARTLN